MSNEMQVSTATANKFIEKLMPQIKRALPAHMTDNRMARLFLTQFSQNKDLMACLRTEYGQKTVAASIMTACQLGLEPGINGQGWLIPYKGACTFVPGWRGLTELANRSGRCTVYTGSIFKDQEFEYIDGARRDLVIKNQTEMFEAADITHTYAIGWVNGATMPVIELWTTDKTKRHRDKNNKVGQKHYSFNHWEMYARKIPLLQVLKYMPMTVELANAVRVSERAESGASCIIEDGVVFEMEQPEGLPELNDSEFEQQTIDWRSAIQEGATSADDAIAIIGGEYQLTEAQKSKIKSWGSSK